MHNIESSSAPISVGIYDTERLEHISYETNIILLAREILFPSELGHLAINSLLCNFPSKLSLKSDRSHSFSVYNRLEPKNQFEISFAMCISFLTRYEFAKIHRRRESAICCQPTGGPNTFRGNSDRMRR